MPRKTRRPPKPRKQEYRERKAVVKRYRGDMNGVSIHEVIAEKALGKPLPIGAQVHHVDGSKDNSSQLVICQDQAYHLMLHARTRIVMAGGNPNTDAICTNCQSVKPRSEFWKSKHRWHGCTDECIECSRTRWKRYAKKRRAA